MHALGLCGPKNNCKKPLIKLVPVRYPKEKPIGDIISHQRPLNVEWPVVIFRKGVSDQKEAQLWMKHNASRNLTRYQAGALIGKSWLRSASVATAINGFKATGIYPVDPNAIPDHFYSITDSAMADTSPERDANRPSLGLPSTSPTSSAQACGRGDEGDGPQITPSKFLQEVSPVPKVPVSFKQRFKQSAAVLTSPENITKRVRPDKHNTTNVTAKKKKLRVQKKTARGRARKKSKERQRR
ncbi:unnamed protein product [Acanthoscelides obtectus]|uniref:Uncharacterized protein n=1 Tax=Acanthoscelides obtectus TaxID=200917 RepID=A0A9P0LZG4_ACAOB|nr:unnamed protein product [Acanthoscelides obtectus]CAK1660957.1 hypothetical protein AOBTE_LOCUS22364 [Acanthoscelides obtectus]